MIPTHEPTGSTAVPDSATFWTPKRSEIYDEGFGFFRGIWTILDVSLSDARRLIEEERMLTTLVNELATNEAEFDSLARALERGDEDNALAPNQLAVLGAYLADEETAPLDGLELGVAGLTYALATVRMFPAASCRGHVGPRPWSDVPVVYLAANRFRAERLQPLVGEAGCRFSIDDARPDLLVIGGGSISDTMRLAVLVVEHRRDFIRPRPPARSAAPNPTLF